MDSQMLHKPVLKDEALESLNIVPDGIYVDATFGRGGHSRSILSRLSAGGKLIALDADPVAVEYAKQQFSDDEKFSVYHTNFALIADICEREKVSGFVNGVLLDLGVSSPQLDEAARGFSFSHDGPLDMRMDTTRGVAASVWLAGAKESEIADVFWRYGEERYSRRIARALTVQREIKPFVNTLALAEAVKIAHPRWEKNKHPATRVFQAIRIYINRELDSLSSALGNIADVLAIGGRLVVISFHSLEDRLVKRFVRGDPESPQPLRDLPVPLDSPARRLRPLGKKIRPGRSELKDNPRARSAVLRVAEKVA
jgi:16S rRNA (cytosine1402-N4)-methyltransferase